MLGRSVGLKKPKKNAQYTFKNVPVFVPVFLYAVTMLIFQMKRIISSEKWLNYVVTFFFFFLKMPKIWVGRTTLNGEKKEDGLTHVGFIKRGIFTPYVFLVQRYLR